MATTTVCPAATFGAPHDCLGLPVAEVDGSDVKVVGIGVRFTGKDFADHESAKPPFMLSTSSTWSHSRPSDVSAAVSSFGESGKVDIAFKPFIRNIHIDMILFS